MRSHKFEREQKFIMQIFCPRPLKRGCVSSLGVPILRVHRLPFLHDSTTAGHALSFSVPSEFGPSEFEHSNRYQAQRAKSVSAALSVAVHIAVIALVLLFAGAPAKQTFRPSIATFDVNVPGPPSPTPPKAPQPHPVPPQPPLPLVIPPPALIIPHKTDIVASLLEQADVQSAVGGCDLTAPVQAALQTSPDVMLQLPTIPVEHRSVANAIAVWNQNWIEPDTTIDKDVYETIRLTIANTIARASESCRLQMQGGPRLMYLPVNGTTTVIALGSGEWTWQQLADSAQPQIINQADQPLLAQRANLELSDMIATMFASPETETTNSITVKHTQMRPGT